MDCWSVRGVEGWVKDGEGGYDVKDCRMSVQKRTVERKPRNAVRQENAEDPTDIQK